MGMRFKLIGVILVLFYSLGVAKVVHQVDVSNSHDPQLKTRLVEAFKGRVVNDEQISEVVKRIYSEGVYQRVDYSLTTTNGVTTLRFDVVSLPVIQSIRFRHLPISEKLVMKGMRNSVGKPFNYHYLDSDIRYINQLLDMQGYFLASVKSFQILPNGVLSIDIESPRLVGVEFIGLQSTKSSVVYREIVSKNGTYVDRYFLDVDYQSLMSLPYFSSVSAPNINYISSDNVTVSYRVKERKMNRLDIGVEELEKDQGVALFSKFKLYHAFIYSDFLVLQAQLGYLNQLNIRTYQIHYQQPWIFNRYQFIFDLKAFTRYRSELIPNDSTPYDTIRTGGSVFLTKPIKRLYLMTGAGVRFEQVYPQVEDHFSGYDLKSLSIFIELNRIKTPLNPKDGYRSKIVMDKGGNIFGVSMGGVDFTRFSVTHTHFVPVSSKWTLAYRLFGGAYNKRTDMTTFETEKFMLGGSNSLRGYKELSFYGNYRASFNLEPRYQWNDSLMGVLFLDGGYISDSLQVPSSFYYGYGIGVRFLNSFMPIRVDLGVGDDVMLHFNVSQTF